MKGGRSGRKERRDRNMNRPFLIPQTLNQDNRKGGMGGGTGVREQEVKEERGRMRKNG